MAADYRFTFGPWNIHEGPDPFGPPIRPTVPFGEKLKLYKQLGFDGMQFHDDDAVPSMDEKAPDQIAREAQQVKRMLDDEGLVAEFVGPRVWEEPQGADGPFTANDPRARQWGLDRAKKAIDTARSLGTRLIVLWFAREGTYIRESKNPLDAHQRLVDAINTMIEYDPDLEVAIEPKPNEPMDLAYLPTIGHALALAQQTADPSRVGGLIESAHSLLAGLDPSDDMGFAMHLGKLYSVHLNDQAGLKFDEDKAFGSNNLRAAWNQVRVLERAGYANTGRFIGFDVKAMRTTHPEAAHKHLANSRRVFLSLVDKVRRWDTEFERQCIENRDYEELERGILDHLLSG